MTTGHFLGGVAALVWRADADQYLLLKRSLEKDFAAGVWECVTGRVEQGESFDQAVLREVREELGVEAQFEFFLGTTHFYRGQPKPENELIGVVCCVSLDQPEQIRLSPEHSEFRWVSSREAQGILDSGDASSTWAQRVLARAARLQGLVNDGQRQVFRQEGLDLG